MPRARWTWLGLALASAACDGDARVEGRGPAPPQVASAQPGACAGGGGKSTDEKTASFFPRVSGEYCIDPNGDVRAYGEDAKGSLEAVCTEQFDGECEVYKRYGLERVVSMRYVDGKGTPGTVSVTLSRFATAEGAYAFFTKRVIADADPLETAPKPLAAGGAAQLGGSNVNLWRADHVVELAYNNERESPDALRASTTRILPALAKAIGEGLTGSKELPAAVSALPAKHRIPLGVEFVTAEALDVAGLGAGAIGYYVDAAKRWRIVSIHRADDAAAGDVLKTLRKLEGAVGLKGVTYDGVQLSRRDGEDAPKIDWVFGRKGTRVFGVGDEEHVLGGEPSAEEAVKVKLDAAAKLALLTTLVTGE